MCVVDGIEWANIIANIFMSPNTVSLRDTFEEEIVKLFMAPRTIFGRLEDGDTMSSNCAVGGAKTK